MPTQNEIRQPMAKLRLVKVLISTIGSSAVKTRQKKAIAETPQIAAQTATEVSCSHSYCGPSSSTYSSEPRNPHMKHAMVKPDAEIANNSRVPSARDKNPDKGIAITSAIRYAVCTQETSVELAERPAWMSLSEAETTWMSRIDMNMPNTMIRNATSRRGAMRSDGAEAVIPGVAVEASAMRETYCGWTMTGESRSASLSASLAPSLVSTVA